MRPTYLQEEKAFYRVDKSVTKEDVLELISENGGSNESTEVTIADVTGLQDELDGKADAEHTHVIADVTGLQDELDGKADAEA